MFHLKESSHLIIPKKILLKIEDKDINFKASQNYQGLLLLENSSLIKCSYLAESEDHKLFIIKVYNFENNISVQSFIQKVSDLRKLSSPYFPEIVEVVSEKDVYQVLVIEKFEPCISLKTLLEEIADQQEIREKIQQNLIFHKLLIQCFEALCQLEQHEEYHGFINVSSISLKPTHLPQGKFDSRDFMEALIKGFSIIIWDYEAHKYWEILTSKPSTPHNNTTPWKSIFHKNLMLDPPEFVNKETLKLSIKYDVWMLGIILIQILKLNAEAKSDLFKDWNVNINEIRYSERVSFLKEFSNDPLLCQVGSFLLKDLKERPSPSELIHVDIINQAKKLYLHSTDLDLKDMSFSYDILNIGLLCTDRNISFHALEILLNEGLKENRSFWELICQESYILIIQHLKLIQKNTIYCEKQTLIEKGIKLLTKLLDYDGTFVNKLKCGGITSIILKLIEQDFDERLLCDFLSHFGFNSTKTLLHFVEKSGFVSKIINSIKSSQGTETDYKAKKKFLLNISHFLKLSTILETNFLTDEELFEILSRIPLIKRSDYTSVKIMKKLLTQYGRKFVKENPPDKKILDIFYRLLFSWFFVKNIVMYESLHSECIMNILPKNQEVPNETGFLCKTCSTLSNPLIITCSQCAFICHRGHETSPMNYQFSACSCDVSGSCTLKGSSIPFYLLSPNNTYLDSLKLTFSQTPKYFKVEDDKNIFLNNESEIGTIVTDMPLCVIKPDFQNLDLEETVCAYYEVEIKLGGFYDQNAVGFTIDPNYLDNEFAGYLDGSIAYHGDDGKVYLNGEVIGQLNSFGSFDVVGCGITNFGTVFFTHNGILLTQFNTHFRGSIFPIISLRGKYSSVRLNFDGSFIFNLEDLKEKKRNNDYVRYLSPLMLESLFIQTEWQEILQDLNQLNPQDWLEQMLQFLEEGKRNYVQVREKAEKETESKQKTLMTERDFNVFKELQNIDVIIKDEKRLIKEFESNFVKDYETTGTTDAENLQNNIEFKTLSVSIKNEANFIQEKEMKEVDFRKNEISNEKNFKQEAMETQSKSEKKKKKKGIGKKPKVCQIF